ncbi:hypothetical protein [[Kitasatospora] papulosa]|uniref:hypothetical protein n=1 Tax=[Kitasatospora] papulosa TaxID=1464011 RepID=UPI003857328B
MVHEPLPLCGTCALQVMANYAAANLAGSEPVRRDVQSDIGTLYQLLDSEGWNQVDLNRASEVLNLPNGTAAKRLAEARKQYAAELNRRAGRNRRQVQIDAVYARIQVAGNPMAVSLGSVMDQLNLKQTTAWDRLEAARTAWFESHPQSA